LSRLGRAITRGRSFATDAFTLVVLASLAPGGRRRAAIPGELGRLALIVGPTMSMSPVPATLDVIDWLSLVDGMRIRVGLVRDVGGFDVTGTQLGRAATYRELTRK